MASPLQIVITVAAIGAATVGGVMYAFSTFVMPGLNRLPPTQGAAAMQQINVTAVRPGLMVAMFGTAGVCLIAAVAAVVASGTSGLDRRRVLVILGAALYLVGGIGVTATVHVPLNDGLAALDPAAAAERWPDFLRSWTTANHVRTALCLVGAVLLTASLVSADD